MRFKSPVYSQASGSIAGITYCRDRGGMYVRQRRIPVNSLTGPRMRASRIFAFLSNRWSRNLTAGQRLAWETYAAAVPLADRLGDYRNVGALHHYVRSNLARLTAGLTRVDDGPTTFNLGEFTLPTVDGFNAADDQYQVNFAQSDDWVTEDGASMLLYSSPPQNPCIEFFKKPYRSHAPTIGSSGSPPPSPATVAAAFNLVVGTRTFVQVRVTRADGRLSLPVRLRGPLSALPPLPLEAFRVQWNAKIVDLVFSQPLRDAPLDPYPWEVTHIGPELGPANWLHRPTAVAVVPPATVRFTLGDPEGLDGATTIEYFWLAPTALRLWGSTGIPVPWLTFHPEVPTFVEARANVGTPEFTMVLDQPVVEATSALGNWEVVYAGTLWTITAVDVAGALVNITATPGAPSGLPAGIEYLAAPHDLHNANGWPLREGGRLL